MARHSPNHLRVLVLTGILILAVVQSSSSAADIDDAESSDSDPVGGESASTTTAASNPGLKVRLSESGLDYFAALGVDVMSARIRGMTLPDQQGTVKVKKVGNVRYKIDKMRVSQVDKPRSSVSVQPGSGVTVSLTGAGISVHGNWQVDYKYVIKIKDHGSFDAIVSGLSASVSATMGTTPSGQPTIRSTGCRAAISGVQIRLSGKHKSRYQKHMADVEKQIKAELVTPVCAEARKAIDVDAAREMATLKMKFDVGKQLVLDCGLVAPPGFSAGGFVETFHRAEFFFVGDTSEAPFQPSPLPNPPSVGRMATVWISDYVLNTAGYAMHKHGALRYTVTEKDLPAADKTLLDLTCCPTCACIGRIIPAAGKLYTNASAELEFATTAPPTAVIGTVNVALSLNGTVTMRARLTNESLFYLLKLTVAASSTALPGLNETTVTVRVESMSATVRVIDTAIGPVSDKTLNTVINYIIKSYVIPRLNAAGARGIPLPRVDHVQFVNTALELHQNAISVSTDVKYVGQHDEKTLYFETVDNINQQ